MARLLPQAARRCFVGGAAAGVQLAGVQAVLEDAAGVGEESRWVTPEVKDLVQVILDEPCA